MHTPSARTAADDLWSVHRAAPSDATRNALMEHYLPMVRFAAMRLAGRNGRRPQTGDIEDLVQYGVFGLRDALRGFDPARGVKFETYALQRVRGAMLDGLKSGQWLPREVRQRLARYLAVHEQLLAERGPGHHAQAAADRLGVDAHAVCQFQVQAGRMTVASLHGEDSRQQNDQDDVPRCNTIPDHREEDAADSQQRRDVRDLLLRELTGTERHLMMLYYYENLSMREVGAVLGISGTRVSQMHSDIVNRLRERFATRMQDDAGQTRSCLHV